MKILWLTIGYRIPGITKVSNNLLAIWAKQLRIHHWIKNVFVLAPLVFSRLFLDLHSVIQAIYCFFAFSIISSSIYILNDIVDIKKDQVHPKKKLRPIASGNISKTTAIFVGIILLSSGLGLAFTLDKVVFLIMLAYVFNNVIYSTYLKHKVIADVLSISIGFMLRFIAGCYVISVEPSRWFMVCGFSLSLFLAFGKRRAELEWLSNGTIKRSDARPTLIVYSKEKLNSALSIMNAICILSYILFVVDPETVARHHSTAFMYTVPMVIYCLFRYMFKTQEGNGIGPVDIILKDKAFIVPIVLWLLVTFSILMH